MQEQKRKGQIKSCACCAAKSLINMNHLEAEKLISIILNKYKKKEEVQTTKEQKSQSINVVIGEIHTMDEKDTVCQAMVIKNGKILQLGGKQALLQKYKPQNPLITDFQSLPIYPGFVDPHNHFTYVMLNNQEVFFDMSPNFNEGPKGLKKRLQDYISSKKQGQWVFGINYDKLFTYQSTIGDTEMINIDNLNQLSPRNPIFILQANTHIAHVNGLAFDRLAAQEPEFKGLDWQNIDSCDSEMINFDQEGGGRFRCEKKDGRCRLTGQIVQPPAVGKFLNFLPNKKIQQKFPQSVIDLIDDSLRRGCTSWHDAGIGVFTTNPVDHYNMFMDMKQHEKRFSDIRVSCMITQNLWQTNKNYLNKTEGENLGKDFRISGVKLWYDGSIQGGSAYMKQSYKIKGADWVSDKTAIDYQVIKQIIYKIIQYGGSVAVHCNGDKASEDIVKLIIEAQQKYQKHEKTIKSRRRHRIEHCTLMDESTLFQMQKQKEGYLIHPSFLIDYLQRYGKLYTNDVLKQNVAQTKMDLVGTATKYNLKPSSHSDYIMSAIDPLSMVSCLVNRTSQDIIVNQSQKISVKDALKTVTINAAQACNIEDIVGSLQVNKCADFVVLQQDPLKCQKTKIGSIQVRQTYVNGRCVFPMLLDK